MKKLIISTALLLAGAVVYAESIKGIGSGFWANREALAAEGCITETGASATCMLFPVGDPKIATVISADGKGFCCWLYDSALNFDAEMAITDAAGVNGTGPGDCFDFGPVGGVSHQQPSREVHRLHRTSGYREGLCDAPLSRGAEAVSLYPGCDADGDCAGSCDDPPSDHQKRNAGAYLKCEPASGTVNFTVRLEKVPN